jgi:hypothetical protein
MDEHELVSKLKEMALELGRTPTKVEFCRHVRGGEYQTNRFGGYVPLLQAAGLESVKFKKQKIDNSIFERDIVEHIENHKPPVVVERGTYPHLAGISDIHWPFHSQRVVDRFYRYCDDKKPEIVLLNGDARDRYSHGRFPRSHNVFTPREEDELAEKLNREFWIEIKKLVPKARLIQTLGNHDVRPLKQVLDAYPAAEDWIMQAMKKSFSFEGVETIFDGREEVMLSDIAIFHGYRSKLGDHRDYTHYNSIVGHTHLGGVVYRRIRGQTIWELNLGYAADPTAKGLTYTPQKITHWTPGFGVVDEYGPRFVAL